MSKNKGASLSDALDYQEKHVRLLSEYGFHHEDFTEFSAYVADTIDLLVNDPEAVTVVTYLDDRDDISAAINIGFEGPKAELAMVIGKRAETVAALHRVFFAVARRMGFNGSVEDLAVNWQPND